MKLSALEIYKQKIFDDKVVHIRDAAKNQGEYTQPVPIGYDIFDDVMLGGVREGDLVIATGLSGHGKTTFFQNVSVNLSKAVFPSIWFTFEVVIDNLYAKFKEMEMEKSENFLIFTPKRNTTGNLSWIKEKIKEGVDKHGTKLVFIDHIDFLTPTTTKTSDQHRMILRNICMELKTMAIELEIAVFLIAHVKKVQGREVEMQDIAESSGIYQNADFVFSVTRQTKKIKSSEGRDIEILTDKSILKMLKNRITGDCPYMKFILENNIIIPWSLKPSDFK